MSIDIVEFIDAQVERSVRADRPREQAAEQPPAHPWRRLLGLGGESQD